MTNVFLYLRVSGTSQVKGDGFPRQLQACTDYSLSQGMKIVNVYKEPWTGTELYRPVLAEMMLSMEKNHHGVKTVIIEGLDRLARDLMIQEGIVAKFQLKGFNLISAKEGADLLSSDPTRKFIRQVLGAVAELDKRMLVARLKASRDRKRAETGSCEGRKGYKGVDGQAIVRHIVALRRQPKYGKRRTLQQIADVLNEEGYTTMSGSKWSLFRVQQMLQKNK
ncbi:MAG: recombinase family protein [Bacteroidales bacterium]|jgi:DNA invertase Pin-like site-specific DNA recombinase